ncbi:alpha/beta hydrolase family protein [Pseudomonas abieticivorans]|uniref:alpha/beta hydrolase family protein n=1 Tax=Pseudomonas abieticivorans TaxID=2931382 RepID=UPI0020C1661C|nr:alpha/beta fold hydrolase [Pseudomonas sp. PIA16]
MTYDPFSRGVFPVGVKSDEWLDTSLDRTVSVEIWYPATEAFAGADLDPNTQDEFVPGWAAGDSTDEVELSRQAAVRNATARTERYPLVLLVHGWAGFRREATFIGTHLASHGYVVVSPDVPSSTFQDVDAFLNSQEPLGNAANLNAHLEEVALSRKNIVPFLISTAAEKLNALTEDVGIVGASFGGWTALCAPAWDTRIAAIVPMCPANSMAPTVDPSSSALDIDWAWNRPTPTLQLVADRDALLPLYGQLNAFRSIPVGAWKRMVILANADHNHFVDNIDVGQEWLREYAQRLSRLFPNGPAQWDVVAKTVVPAKDVCRGADAHVSWRGLTLAHLDAHLRGDQQALGLLSGNIEDLMARHDVIVSTVGNHD